MRNQTLILGTLLSSLVAPAAVSAHCDTTSGPVITAARSALEARDANLVLHWVRPEDEAAIQSAFEQTLAVRVQGPEAKALADRSFFETLVRIHRAGEGAAFTGLAEGEPEPIIKATDEALAKGSAEELERMLVGAVEAGLEHRFEAARAARDFRPGDVSAGRAYVAAYVPLTHWVEGVFSAASGEGCGHSGQGEQAAAHPIGHDGAQHGDSAGPDAGHARGELAHVPWILAIVLGIVACVEGAFLLRRRRHASA